MLSWYSWDKIVCNNVLIFLVQHSTGKSRRYTQCRNKSSVQCCLNTLETTLHSSKPYAMLSERLQATFHCKKSYAIVLILSGQCCTGQNFIQCCARCYRQHWVKKAPVQFWLNILGMTLHRSKLYAMLSERLQTTFHKRNYMLFPLNNLSTALHWPNPYSMLSERLQTTLHKKKSCGIYTLGIIIIFM